ncbi:hypothetical protein KM043_018490 [Ampulex compressa]|nr:hypothetical protein KM043_018490 [Ampulex compressa]
MADIKLAKNVSELVKMVCPSPEELSIIANNVRCEKCGLIFRNEPRYRLHDLKVHQHKNLDKTIKENVQYHCPVESCIYALESQRHFSTMKYLKQHYLKVHAKKTHSCTRCDKSFSTEAAKEGHMRVCGIEFTCSCSKTYTTYEALLTHAKRLLHTVNDKYKNSSRRTSSKTLRVVIPANTSLPGAIKPVTILPTQTDVKKPDHKSNQTQKVTADIGVQTDEYKKSKRVLSPSKCNNNYYNNGRRRVSKQTQTTTLERVQNNERSMETQTIEDLQTVKGSLKIRKRRKTCGIAKKTDQTILKEDLSLGNFTSSNLFPGSPLPLRHDVALQDFWEEKNTSGTQTIPQKDMFEVLNHNVTQTEYESFYTHSANPLIQCVPKSTVALMTLPYAEDTSNVEGYSFASSDGVSRSDPMLTDKTFDDKFSSIETQTEQAYSRSFFDSDTLSRSFTLSSTIETQTTNNLDNMEQLLYNNTCTQTCNEILPPDLGLSDIQTQTPWTQLDDTTVSAETQTKSLICETGCNMSMGTCRSWLSIQTSHTETQTDLLSIFEGLQ